MTLDFSCNTLSLPMPYSMTLFLCFLQNSDKQIIITIFMMYSCSLQDMKSVLLLPCVSDSLLVTEC